MKNPEPNGELETLLRDASADSRPAGWAQQATRGLETRVLHRLAKPDSWTDAFSSLTSWRPLTAALAAVVIIGIWSGRNTTDVFSEDWLTSQSAEEQDGSSSAGSVDDLEFDF